MRSSHSEHVQSETLPPVLGQVGEGTGAAFTTSAAGVSAGALLLSLPSSAGGVPFGGINDAIRQMMADVKTEFESVFREFLPAGVVVPFYNVSLGGTENRNPIFWGQSEPDTGWLICDGGSDGRGGTVPDLRDRFIRGASSPENAGNTGGADSVTPTVTVASATTGAAVQATTLTTNQIPSHNHPIVAPDFNVTPYPQGGILWASRGGAHIWTSQNSEGSQSHTHGLTDNGHTYTAQGSAVSILPRYYNLLYCVKLSE